MSFFAHLMDQSAFGPPAAAGAAPAPAQCPQTPQAVRKANAVAPQILSTEVKRARPNGSSSQAEDLAFQIPRTAAQPSRRPTVTDPVLPALPLPGRVSQTTTQTAQNPNPASQSFTFQSSRLSHMTPSTGSSAFREVGSPAASFNSPASSSASYSSFGLTSPAHSSASTEVRSPAANFYSPASSSASYSSFGLTSPMRQFSLNSPGSIGSTITDPYANTPFIKNAKTKRSTIKAIAEEKDLAKRSNFSITLDGKQIDIDGKSLVYLGSGNFCDVYGCERLDNKEKLAIRLFRTNLSSKAILLYVGRQFIRYAKIQTNEFLKKSHVPFKTFDALIEKAKATPSLLKEIQSLQNEDKVLDALVRFVSTHLTEGYVVVEFDNTSLPSSIDTLKSIHLLNTIFLVELKIPLDPQYDNFTKEVRVRDIYELANDDEREADLRTDLKNLIEEMKLSSPTDEIYEAIFEAPLQLQKEHTLKTDWGRILNSSSKDLAAAGPGY